jgi:hypothetical protein
VSAVGAGPPAVEQEALLAQCSPRLRRTLNFDRAGCDDMPATFLVGLTRRLLGIGPHYW